MDPMEEIKQTFFVECEDLLEVLEAGLISISENSHDADTVDGVFRAVHSIKGGAGAFALDTLVTFAHAFENALDLLRSGNLPTDPETVGVLLRSGDILSDLVSAARDGADGATDASRDALERLRAITGGNEDEGPTLAVAADAPDAEDHGYQPQPIALAEDGAGADPVYEPQPIDLPAVAVDSLRRYAISIKPHTELFAHGSELTLVLRALADLGEVEASADISDIPTLDSFDPDRDHLACRVVLTTDQERAAVEEVFDFVDTECDLEISELTADDTPDLPDAPADEGSAGDSDGVAEQPDRPARETQGSAEDGPGAQPQPSGAAAQARATLRVDVDRVDRLVNLVGELVIAQAGIAEYVDRAAAASGGAASNSMEEFTHLTRELQESVMALRTQPVKSLFQRMQRISREASSAAGKSVRLQTSGESTEVDKTVIERLADPLTHMIRNAIDHGLEPEEMRRETGKDPVGTVLLSAAHRSGRVVIEIADDGRGIDRERVLAKAIDKGLVSPEESLSPAEIDQLLFAPGFSTAAQVTSLSGRGVGMDVVKRSIQALGGRIAITTQEGQGTTFSISLPLTLAVLDGMIVRVSGHTVVVPLTAILETHKPEAEKVVRVAGEEPVLSIRSHLVPLVDVGRTFGYREPVRDLTGHVAVVVESEGGRRAALVVDEIVDQRQVVIKALNENYGEVDGISAATILGDGTIALILDTDELIAPVNGDPQALGAVA